MSSKSRITMPKKAAPISKIASRRGVDQFCKIKRAKFFFRVYHAKNTEPILKIQKLFGESVWYCSDYF